MKSSKIAIACIFCLYALLLFSCKTTDEAAKQKEQPLPAAEKSGDSKAAMYHALARALNQQCPLQVDDDTVLTEVSYQEEQKVLIYTYKLITNAYAETEINKQQSDMIAKVIKSALIERLKTNQLLYQLREDRITLFYAFQDKNGKDMFVVTIEPGEY